MSSARVDNYYHHADRFNSPLLRRLGHIATRLAPLARLVAVLLVVFMVMVSACLLAGRFIETDTITTFLYLDETHLVNYVFDPQRNLRLTLAGKRCAEEWLGRLREEILSQSYWHWVAASFGQQITLHDDDPAAAAHRLRCA